MVTGKYLLAVCIWLPVLAALCCLLAKKYFIRNITTWLACILLAACSIAMFLISPFSYQPAGLMGISWNIIITVADFCLMAFILFLGIKHRHLLISILALAQAALLIYFEFVLGGGHIEVKPAFVVDNLAIIMGFIINIVGSLICVYGVRYIADYEKHHPVTKTRQTRFMFWLIIFLGAMNGIIFSNSLYWVFFFWEVTTFCSFQLIGHDQTGEAIRNACRALWMNSLGGTAFAAALVLLLKYGSGDFLSIQFLLDKAGSPQITSVLLLAIGLMVFAGMTKSAQIPFQNWLLGAMVAPTPVSALLHSSTMVKAGVYLILRLAPLYAGTVMSNMVALLGGFTFMVTSILAISQTNAKRVLAYSTIANLGLIIACAGINTPIAISAAIVLIIFHAVSKGLLFLCTGFVQHRIGSLNIEDMEGLADKMPKTAAIYTVGIIGMFLPPFGMLVGKWAGIEAAAKLPVVALLIVIASAVTAIFWVKWLGRMMQGVPGAICRSEHMPVHYAVSMGGLAAGTVLLGMFIVPLVSKIVSPAVLNCSVRTGLKAAAGSIVAGSEGVFLVWPLFILMLVTVIAVRIIYKPNKIRQVPVYMCGENSGGLSCTDYITTGETTTSLSLSNYYFADFLNEDKWAWRVDGLSIVMMIVLLGVTIL